MNLLNDIRDFFFPRTCIICEEQLKSAETGICVFCSSSLPHTGLLNTPNNEMEKYFWGRFNIERASSLFIYEKGGVVAKILHAMKYHGRKDVCVLMGEALAAELSPHGFFESIDCILPVPLHKKRYRQRGYNQSEQLAIGISRKTNIPVYTNLILRERNNETQTKKGSYARWENVKGLFMKSPSATSFLHKKHILLVDDVLTTGATLIACADALSDIESIRISVVTLALAK